MSKIVNGTLIGGGLVAAGAEATAFINGAYPNIEDANHLDEIIRTQYQAQLSTTNTDLSFMREHGHNVGETPQALQQAEAAQKHAQGLFDSLNTETGRQTARIDYVNDLIRGQYMHHANTLQNQLYSRLDSAITQQYTTAFHTASFNLQGLHNVDATQTAKDQVYNDFVQAQKNLDSLSTPQGMAAARTEYLQQHANDTHDPFIQLHDQLQHAQAQLRSLSTPQGMTAARNSFLESNPQLHGALNSDGKGLLDAGADQVRHDFDRVTHDVGHFLGERTPAQIADDITRGAERAWNNTYDTAAHPKRTMDAIGRRIQDSWDRVRDIKLSQIASDLRGDADDLARDVRNDTDNVVRETEHGVRVADRLPTPGVHDDVHDIIRNVGHAGRTGVDKVGEGFTDAARGIEHHPAETGIVAAVLAGIGGAFGIAEKIKRKHQQQEQLDMSKGGKGK